MGVSEFSFIYRSTEHFIQRNNKFHFVGVNFKSDVLIENYFKVVYVAVNLFHVSLEIVRFSEFQIANVTFLQFYHQLFGCNSLSCAFYDLCKVSRGRFK